MKTLALALRNLLRNRRRSLATVLAIVVGLGAILIFGGYSRNAIYAMQTGYVQLHGHLQIQHKDYFLYGSGNPAAYGIAGYRDIIAAIRADKELAPLVTVVTPKLQLGGIAGNFAAAVSRNVAAAGVIPEDQNGMRLWDDYGSASYTPKIALTGTRGDAVVIGTGVARMLQLCAPLKVANCGQPAKPAAEPATDAALPDDIGALAAATAPATDNTPAGSTAIEMLAANVHGAPNVASLHVVKAENWGLKEFDDSFMVMHLAQAQKLIFGGAAPQVTAIQIQLHHTAQIPAARARLQHLLAQHFGDAPLAVIDYETLAPIYGQTIEFFDSVFGFISTLIGVIVLFTVGNTMSTAVVERTTEIGTLRAIGLRRGAIRRLFVCEGALLGAIGALLGVLGALLAAYLINHAGLSWTPPGYVYAYPLRVRLWGDPGLICGTAIGMLAVAICSAWWPAHRAARLMIVDALRHV